VTVAEELQVVRQFSPEIMFLYGGFEGGSCPYLYASGTGDDEVAYGHVLVGRSAPTRYGVATRKLRSDFSGEVIIREEEKEISFIDRVWLELRGPDGDVREQLEAPTRQGSRLLPAILNEGEELRVRFDFERCEGCDYRVHIAGYFTELEQQREIFRSTALGLRKSELLLPAR
jgi:hypothetical protein